MQKLLEHYGSIWEIRPYGQAHGDCSTFLNFGYSQYPMSAHGGPILPIPPPPPPCWGFWAAHPGAGWLETGFQVAAHPGARWPETPNSRGFWPSRTRKPRFSGGELVEAKCIVLYVLRLCYIFLRFSMFLATGPGQLLSAFSRIPKT